MEIQTENKEKQEMRRPSETVFPDEEDRQFDPELPLIKTLQSFVPPKQVIPFWSYVNLGYIHPLMADFKKQSAKNNIFLVVSVRDTDLIDSKPLKNIYGTSSCSRFQFEAQTTIHYKTECPSWLDEIKFNIPAKLSEKHHLLFTFHSVGAVKSSKKEPKTDFLGYCYLPLYPNKWLVILISSFLIEFFKHIITLFQIPTPNFEPL